MDTDFNSQTLRKRCPILAVIVVLLFLGCGDHGPSIDELPPLPDSISTLPLGIVIQPEQSIADAEKYEGASLRGLTGPNIYTWDHTLNIQSRESDVQIIEYGVYGWVDGQWVDVTDEQKPYTAEDFAEVFDCEQAILKAGEIYESDLFGNVSNVLRDEPVFYRWYFIGQTAEGRCRGEVTLMDRPPKSP